MLFETLPPTPEGAHLAVVIAAIQRATPWLRVDGVLSLDHDEQSCCSALCFDTRHQIVVSFATLAS